jgi:hypothetical protein
MTTEISGFSVGMALGAIAIDMVPLGIAGNCSVYITERVGSCRALSDGLQMQVESLRVRRHAVKSLM